MKQRMLKQILSGISGVLAILAVAMIVVGVARNASSLPMISADDALPSSKETAEPATQNQTETEPTDPWLEAQDYVQTEHWEEALPLLMDAVQDAPEQAERYAVLSQAHQATGNLQAALETLQSGIEHASDTEILEPSLQALEQTMALPDIQQTYLQQMEIAFAQEDKLQLEELLEKWVNAQNHAANANSEVSWVHPSDLIWYQGSFYAEFTGTGLAFDGPSMYYGPLQNGVPNGTGIYVTVNTMYQDGTISYMLITGNWKFGILTDQARFEEWTTGTERKMDYAIDAVLAGEEERFVHADIKLMYPFLDDGNHQFDLSITEGRLQLDNAVPGYGGTLEIPCCVHDGCTVSAIIDTDDQAVFYQNPYPWDKDWPYQPAMPRVFLNFGYQLA